MDLLERPDIKNTYDKCKYIVKVWEHDFKKAQGRLPSKLDIREADRRVRDAYKKYYQLKTAALEQSFKDVDGFYSDEETQEKNVTLNITENDDKSVLVESESQQRLVNDTWGFHLDKQVKKIENTNTLNTSITKKLFCGSKLSKRYSRKSLSFSQKKSETNFDSSVTIQPTKSFAENESNDNITSTNENDPLTFEGIFSKSTVKVTAATEKISTQPINIIQSVLDNNYKSLKSVDAGWLERVGASSGVSVKKPIKSFISNFEDESNMSLDYNSDDIIDNSDDEASLNLGHPSKKLKIDSSQSFETAKINKCEIYNQNVEKTESDYNKPQNIESSNTPYEDPFEFKDDDIIDVVNVPENQTSNTNKKYNKVKLLNSNNKLKSQNIRQSSRLTKSEVNMTESHSEDEDPFHSDNNSDDPEFTPNQSDNKQKQILLEVNKNIKQSGQKRNKLKTKKIINKKEIENDTEEANLEYELEYSIKPRISAPRFKNLKKLIKIETSSDTKQGKEKSEPQIKEKCHQQLEKLEKKIQSGSLNDNFVTINLKKKIYCRVARESALAIRKSSLEVKLTQLEVDEQENKSEESGDDLFDDQETDMLLAETLKLEEHAAKLNLQSYLDFVKVVDPYYKLNDDGTVIGTSNNENFIWKINFGYIKYRFWKKFVLSNTRIFIFSERTMHITDCFTSCIFDGRSTACLHSNQTKVQRDKIMEAISSGNLNVLLVSPEAVVSGEKSM
ncbi:Drc1-Sld2 domain containing protein, partial [Asbolus verrucosus]